MFDIGWTELLLIGIVALIVVGPKDLPRMFRTLGQFTARMRGMAREFQRAMDSAADESGVREMGRDLRNMASGKGLGLDDIERSIGGDLTAPAKSGNARSTAAKPAAADATPTATETAPATTPTPEAAAKATAKAAATTPATATPKPAAKKAAAAKPAAKKPAAGKPATAKAPAAKPRAKRAAAAGNAPKGTE